MLSCHAYPRLMHMEFGHTGQRMRTTTLQAGTVRNTRVQVPGMCTCRRRRSFRRRGMGQITPRHGRTLAKRRQPYAMLKHGVDDWLAHGGLVGDVAEDGEHGQPPIEHLRLLELKALRGRHV